ATTAFAIRDFNPKDSAHAGRTKEGASGPYGPAPPSLFVEKYYQNPGMSDKYPSFLSYDNEQNNISIR
ncbi:hypothetical protein ACFSF2_15780, partial [Paenibacillus rhizophilus]